MSHRIVAIVSVLGFFFIAGDYRVQAAAAAGRITGTVFYRQRIALPPDALLEVLLVDNSLGEGSAKALASTTIQTAGRQAPIPFKLVFNPSRIQFSHRYRLSAKITENGNLLFASTQAYPVLANHEASADQTIMLEQAPARSRAYPPLEDTDWRLIELNGRPIRFLPGQREAHIVLHAAAKNFSGSGGCNRLMGSFSTEGLALHFQVVGSTMMACPVPQMKLEQGFTQALAVTTRYHIAGGVLELSDGRQIVARFETQQMK